MIEGDKRGISDIVTTVLLILLAIAAVGIIWVVIQGFINSGTKGVGSAADCLQNNFEVVSAVNVSTTASSIVNVTVKSIGPGQASIDKILFYYNTGSQTSKLATEMLTAPAIGESNRTTVNIGASGGMLKQDDSIQVAAVIAGTTCSPSEAKAITGI